MNYIIYEEEKIMGLDKILKDVLEIGKLLDEYYVLVYKDDSSKQNELSEAEILTKESVIKDLKILIRRLDSDIQSFGKTACKSKKQQEQENRNLVDLVGEVKHTLKRLKRFGVDDVAVKELFENMSKNISEFKEVLKQYRDKSSFKVYDWSSAVKQNSEEEKLLDEEFNNLLT